MRVWGGEGVCVLCVRARLAGSIDRRERVANLHGWLVRSIDRRIHLTNDHHGMHHAAKAPRRVRWGRALAAAGLAALVQVALRPWIPLAGGDGAVLTVTGSAVGGRWVYVGGWVGVGGGGAD